MFRIPFRTLSAVHKMYTGIRKTDGPKKGGHRIVVHISSDGSAQKMLQNKRFFERVVYPIQLYSMRNSEIYLEQTNFDGWRHTYTFVVKREEDIDDYIARMEQILGNK